MEPRLRSIFVKAVRNAKQSLGTLKNIEKLIIANNITKALERAIIVNVSSIIKAQRLIYVTAGNSGASFLTKALESFVDFNASNARAVKAIKNNRLELINDFSAEQRKTTKQAIVSGTKRGLNPREQARNFRDSIGLTSSQLHAVDNYRRLLEQGSSEALDRKLRDRRFDRTVNNAIDSGVILDDSQINKMVDRYRERYIKYRSEVIARTESLSGVHTGNDELYKQAIEQGKLNPDLIDLEWVSTMSPRTRDSHRNLNGVIKNYGESFQGLNGKLRFPGDPRAAASEVVQCTCSMTTRIRRSKR